MTDLSAPYDEDLERSVLSGCILYEDHREAVLDALDSGDFYATAHRQTFEAIRSLVRRKESVELVSIASEMRKAGTLDNAGGATFVNSLLDNLSPMDPENAARKLKGFSIQRKLIEACTRTIAKALTAEGDPSAVLDETQAAILELDTASARVDTLRHMEAITATSYERYEAMNRGDFRDGICTGFSELDKLTGGFRGGKLIIIAARPGIGKTAFMLSMARNMGQDRRRAAIFSFEMDEAELDDRLTAMEARINTVCLSTGRGPTREQWEKVAKAAAKKSAWPIWIDDSGGLNIGELKRRCRRSKKMGAEIIFIDQLSKIRGGEGRSEYEKRSSIVNDIAALAKELRIPVVLLAQINRGAEARTDKRPTLVDLKSTGSLEEDADIILLGHRPHPYTKKPEDEHRAEWDLAKHRGGPTRRINMIWHPKLTMFSDSS